MLDKLIHEFLNKDIKESNVENEYTIKIQSTVEPEEKASFNEVFENAHEQLKLKL